MISAFSQLFALALPEVSVTMPSLGAWCALLCAGVLLLFSAFASGSEIAFFSLSRAEIEEAEESKTVSAQRIIALLKEPERLLATILIINDFVNVGIVMLLNYFFLSIFSFGESAKWIEFLVLTVLLTFLLLLFCEVMPKIYSKNNVRKFAYFAVDGLYLLFRLLRPFSSLLVRSTYFTERISSKASYSLSVDELEQALELTDKKEIGEQKNMLEGIIRFGDETVRNIMTPRMDMVMLNIRASYTEVLRCAADNAYSRIPVYAGTQDEIRGILYIKDILNW